MPLLDAKDVNVYYEATHGDRIWAVRDVSLSLEEGEFVGVVGESGCGKSTLGFALTQMLKPPAHLTGGAITFDGREVTGLSPERLRAFRRGGIALVLQSGMNALNPVRNVENMIGDVLKAHAAKSERPSSRQIHQRATELLQMVELPPEVLKNFPHELSGGMRQRTAIALALALEPRVIVFDEPTTALDVLVQAAVLKTIKELQRMRKFAALLISHDMSVVLGETDRTIVMYGGRIVEDQPSSSMLSGEHHPYTEALMRCYGDPRADRIELSDIAGSPPDLSLPDQGCSFAPRCKEAEEVCTTSLPLLHPWRQGRLACHTRAVGKNHIGEADRVL